MSAGCEKCERLEEEVAWLKGELGLQLDASHIEAVRQALKIKPHGARIVLMLHAVRGRVLTFDQLLEGLPARWRTEDQPSLVKSHVCYINRASKGLIENVWGTGYRLPSASIDRISEILATVRGPLRASDTVGAERP